MGCPAVGGKKRGKEKRGKNGAIGAKTGPSIYRLTQFVRGGVSGLREEFPQVVPFAIPLPSGRPLRVTGFVCATQGWTAEGSHPTFVFGVMVLGSTHAVRVPQSPEAGVFTRPDQRSHRVSPPH